MQALATADEEAVAKALVPAIAQQMRTRSSVGKQQGGTSAASAANYAAVSMSARAAGTLVRAAREHLRRQVADLAALAADIQEDEVAAAAGAAPGGQQQAQQVAAGGGGLGANDDLSAAELAHIQREVAQAGAAAGTPEQLAAAEVSIAPAAALQWTAGWVRWVWAEVGWGDEEEQGACLISRQTVAGTTAMRSECVCNACPYQPAPTAPPSVQGDRAAPTLHSLSTG